MDDLISRQVAIDAVGNMLRRKFGIGGDLANITLADLPSADAVPVVRCQECKYSETASLNITGKNLGDLEKRHIRFCNYDLPSRIVADIHFCSYGGRKDDDRQ